MPTAHEEPYIDWTNLERIAIALFDVSCHANESKFLEQLYQSPDQDAYIRALPHHHRYLFLVDVTSGHQDVFISGTDIKHPLDWLVSHLAPQVYDAELDASFQRELLTSVNAAVDDLETILDPLVGVSVSGYSSGGMMAPLVGSKLMHRGYDVHSVITLGQSPVTDAHGAQSFAEVPLVRVIAGRDWATMRHRDNRRHFGDALVLLEGAEYAYLRNGDFHYALSTDPSVGTVDFFSHTNYIPHILSKVAGARLVPYRLTAPPLRVHGVFPCDFSYARE